MKKGVLGSIILALIIFGGIAFTLSCAKKVPAGYVGVVYDMNGGIDGEILDQ